jgi:hypothetical protein
MQIVETFSVQNDGDACVRDDTIQQTESVLYSRSVPARSERSMCICLETDCSRQHAQSNIVRQQQQQLRVNEIHIR